MKILTVDSSTRVASAALTQDDALVCECNLITGLTHSQRLMVLVENCFDRAGWTPGDIDMFAVVCGPGSFTGVRIGVSAVKGMADVFNKPVVALNTLEVLAAGLPYACGLVVPLLDARRGQVYAAAYRWVGDALTEVIAPEALALQDFLEKDVLAGQGPVIFLGDGADANREVLQQHPGALFAPMHGNYQRAAAAGYLAYLRRGDAVQAGEIQPQYFRLSQAERQRRERDHGG